MAHQIVIKKRFVVKVERVFNYLKTDWSIDVAEKFIFRLQLTLHNLSQQPKAGKALNDKSNIRSFLITKHNKIYYKITEEQIIILNMFDTRINPNRNPYSKSE